jgi:hypothetical protein
LDLFSPNLTQTAADHFHDPAETRDSAGQALPYGEITPLERKVGTRDASGNMDSRCHREACAGNELRGIWVANSDGQGRRKLLPLPTIFQASACWSPDGKRIAAIVIDRTEGADNAKAKLVIQEVDGEGRTEFPLDDVKQTDMPDWR